MRQSKWLATVLLVNCIDLWVENGILLTNIYARTALGPPAYTGVTCNVNMASLGGHWPYATKISRGRLIWTSRVWDSYERFSFVAESDLTKWRQSEARTLSYRDESLSLAALTGHQHNEGVTVHILRRLHRTQSAGVNDLSISAIGNNSNFSPTTSSGYSGIIAHRRYRLGKSLALFVC